MSPSAGDTPASSPSTFGAWLTTAVAALLTLGAAAWALELPRIMAWSLYPQQFLAAALALALPLAFLMLPARRGAPRGAIPWYDYVAAVLGFLAAAWIAVRYPDLINTIFARPAAAYVPGVIIVVLLLEALRRATGWALVIIVAAFLVYAMFGNYLPGRLAGRAQDWQKLSAYLALDANGILGLPMSVAATIVVAFVFFGNVLGATGGSRFFTDASLVAMGRFRGGPMKIAVLASCLFGSISGSAVANVVATGIVSIPLMRRAGYPPHKAGAVEAVASTGGQLMPPVMGAAAFVMAEFLQVSYAAVALSALVPGVLYYAALFIQADLESAKLGMSGVPRSEIPPARSILTGWHFVAAFALLIIALFQFNWLPERAALLASGVAVVLALALGYKGRRPNLRELASTFSETGRGVVDIILISAGAGMVIGVLNVTGLSFNLTYLLVQIGGASAILLLVLSAIVCIVLGMGLPTLGVYVLLAALVAPAMVELGINPMAAHLFVLYFGMMSMITPPVAVAAFAAAAIAKADPMRTGFEAVRFGWTAFVVPFLFVASPTLILIGTPVAIAQAVATAFAGVWLISIAMAGHFVRPLGWPMRVLFAGSGLLALIPAGAFPGAEFTDLAGVLIGAALIAHELMHRRAGMATLRAAGE
ncbi:MAG TPA: TRAP transporter fused permease subunit [Xanthobacteraceae bacterium]|nr:TRAP transporter fused permease subunit [Xanthobacteraceae bacterium]